MEMEEGGRAECECENDGDSEFDEEGDESLTRKSVESVCESEGEDMDEREARSEGGIGEDYGKSRFDERQTDTLNATSAPDTSDHPRQY